MKTNLLSKSPLRRLLVASVLGLGPAAVTAQAASLEVDFQATIASEQHPDFAGEARYFHVSMNPANPGTGSYAATIVGTNNPAPRFVRNFDGPVVGYKFVGGVNDDITSVAMSGGDENRITYATSDTAFDGFAQQQAKVWDATDPGFDIKVSGSNPFGVTADKNAGLFRSLGGAVGTIDISGMAAGSVHIYYGAFSATPSVSVVMRDTDGVAPDITIANAHLNGDLANRTEYYLAEIDFVTDGVYDEIEYTWLANGVDFTGNGRGIGTVLTEAVADAVAPTLDPADIVDSVGGGPILSDGSPLSYTVTYSELMDPATITTDDFEIIGTGTAGGAIQSVVHYGGVTTVNVLPTVGTTGTIQLQVKQDAVLTDLAGNELDTSSAIPDDTVITVNPDITAPTVVSIKSPPASGTIYGSPTIPYTVTFSEFVDPLGPSDFTNAGTAAISIGTVTDSSPGAPQPSVYTVQVIPSGTGTVQLQVQDTVQDGSGNPLAAPVTDTVVYNVNAGTEPERETVTLDGFTTSDLQTNPHDLVFDASASDKLVVIVTGENGNPGVTSGQVNSLTYDGVALTKAVGRLPIDSAPSAPFDQLFNDIWYLDNPAAATASASIDDPDLLTTGNIRASLSSSTRAVITAFRLSGTAPGFGATAISAQEVKSVSLLAGTSGGMVIASLGMGGNGNTADTQNVNTVPGSAEQTAVKQGSDFNGHVTSRAEVTSPGVVTSTFTGGNTVGTHTIAAEFKGALVGSGSPYDTWASVNAPSGTPADDFDGDGVSNGVEFVLGGDKDTNDLDKLPAVETSGGDMTFTFVRDQDSIDPSVAVSIEVGTSLATWPDEYPVPDTPTAGPPVAVVDNGDGTDTVTLTVTQAPDTKKFARLKVVITP